MIVGLDFDNTIISYDDAMRRYVLDNGLCGQPVPKDKKTIRDAVRGLDEGEMLWRKLQAHVYGPGIGGGVLNEGAAGFIRLCREKGVPVCIVSHKTRYAAHDETGTDLRLCALAWMEETGFFKASGLGSEDVFFEDTRAFKIERMSALGCTHFVDDLEETFTEPSFPGHVMKILFAPHGTHGETGRGIVAVRRFHDIGPLLFKRKA